MKWIGWWSLLRQTRRDIGGYGLSSGYGHMSGAYGSPPAEPPIGYEANRPNPSIWELEKGLRKRHGDGDDPGSRTGRWS